MYTAKQIAVKYDLTIQRVYQLRDLGLLTVGKDGKPQQFTEESVKSCFESRKLFTLEERISELEREVTLLKSKITF